MAISVRVVEVISESQFVLNCALCRGSGNKPGYKSHVPCDVCTGKGLAMVEGQEPFVACRLCSGSGNKPGYKSYVACDACQGVGAQPIRGRLEILS